MKFKQVVEHFGGIRQTAEALGISYQAVRSWREKGEIPEVRQFHIQTVTKNKLKADEPKRRGAA